MIVWHFDDCEHILIDLQASENLLEDLTLAQHGPEQPWQSQRRPLKIGYKITNSKYNDAAEDDLEDEDYPEHPRHPQWTHSTILPSSNLFFGTRQMQFVAKFVSRVCKEENSLDNYRQRSPGCNEGSRGFHIPASSTWQSGLGRQSSPEICIIQTFHLLWLNMYFNTRQSR